jgi:ribosomal protein S18 acetylase RimI-like enzyme
MNIIVNFDAFIREKAAITIKDKVVYADNNQLKGMDVMDVASNIRIVYFKESGFYPDGKFWCYFLDSEEATPKVGKEIELLMFPYRRGGLGDRSTPITDIWNKSHTKTYRGSEHILGIVEGTANQEEIYIEMMSVRPEYKRNGINTMMIDALKYSFPNTKLKFEDPTVDGVHFMRRYSPDADVKWISNRRPKNW